MIKNGLSTFSLSSGPVNPLFLGGAGSFSNISPGGNGVKTNEPGMVDATFPTCAVYTVTGNSSSANSAQSSFAFNRVGASKVNPPFTLHIFYDVPTNSLNGGGSTALAIVGVSYDDSSNTLHQVFPVEIPAGTVQAETSVTVSIPKGAKNFSINASVQTRSIDTAGTLTLRIFEAWVTF
jgi:hypothetical protein